MAGLTETREGKARSGSISRNSIAKYLGQANRNLGSDRLGMVDGMLILQKLEAIQVHAGSKSCAWHDIELPISGDVVSERAGGDLVADGSAELELMSVGGRHVWLCGEISLTVMGFLCEFSLKLLSLQNGVFWKPRGFR